MDTLPGPEADKTLPSMFKEHLRVNKHSAMNLFQLAHRSNQNPYRIVTNIKLENGAVTSILYPFIKKFENKRKYFAKTSKAWLSNYKAKIGQYEGCDH